MAIPSLPELLLPAGGFDAALAAFSGGADAVYLGFKAFSARRQAANFDLLEYRRLHAHAAKEGKRLYVTLNTSVAQAELGDLLDLLAFLEDFPPGAVIFQDWGLASLIKERFPSLHLHASTQTALQTPGAARRARDLGVERLVLPREAGLEEFRRFKAEVPEMELEVFVHGALCYSFSGLCLASGLLLGRSANRGECAQLCRSYYRRDLPGQAGTPGNTGYFFSCNDLDLSASLGELCQAGVDSLKVEGRMKSPEYVHAVARLYRAGLDRVQGRGPSDEEFAALAASARSAFGRKPSRAYLRSPKGEDLVDSTFPGHRGVVLGRVVSASGGRATVSLDLPLGLRDGVLYLEPREAALAKEGLADSQAFPALGLEDPRTGRPLVTARAGSQVTLDLPRALPPGTELRRISVRAEDLRKPSPEEYPPSLRPVPARLGVEASPGGGRLTLEIEVGHGTPPVRLLDTEVLPLEAGRTPGGFSKVLALLAESGDEAFRLEASFAEGTVEVQGLPLPLGDLFIPPSLLKKAKHRLYEAAREALARPRPLIPAFDGEGGRVAPPPRSRLSFPKAGLPSGLPFATPQVLREGLPLPVVDGIAYLPLSPLVAEWGSYASQVVERVRTELGMGRRLCIGVGAFHHLDLLPLLRALPGADSGLTFFGDLHLNLASLPARAFWARELSPLAFLYASPEFPPEDAASLGLARVDQCLRPPLFLSRACYLRHNRGGGACPAGCQGSFQEVVRDRERSYLVLGEDCVTMLFSLE